MNKFISFYKKVKPQIQEEIKKYNQEILKEDNHFVKDNLNIYADLGESGKMIRGTLIALAYSFKNKDISYAIPMSTAYEIFETSILVHDDVIDNDDLRRWKQTVNCYNKTKYQGLEGNEHLADSMGICVGDFGLYSANRLIVDAYADHPNFKNIFNKYNNIVLDTIRGEIIDTTLPFEEKNDLFSGNTEENVMEIYRLKTAYYTLVGPLSLGMLLANHSDAEIKDIEKFSLSLGTAFQIQDDLFGIFAETSEIGKTVGSDIKEYKQTLLYSYIKNTKYYDEFKKYYGKTDYDLKHVQELLEKSGAKEYCMKKMESLYQDSLEVLEKIKWLNKEEKDLLKDLVIYLSERKK